MEHGTRDCMSNVQCFRCKKMGHRSAVSCVHNHYIQFCLTITYTNLVFVFRRTAKMQVQVNVSDVVLYFTIMMYVIMYY
jgi:hypothetical protein